MSLDAYGKPSETAERYDPSTDAIQQLVDMPNPRSSFGVCWHQGSVYLCGGSHLSIDQFHPQNSVFSTVCVLPQPITCLAAFVSEGSLMMISTTDIWKQVGQKWTSTPRSPKQQRLFGKNGSSSAVAVIGHYYYCIYEDNCLEIDIHSFAETTYPFFRS